MLCRQFILSVVKKRCISFGVQASKVACGYVEKSTNSNNLGYSISHRSDITDRQHNLNVIKRFKTTKRSSKRVKKEQDEGSSDEDEDDDDDVPQDKNSPVLSFRVNSLRVDVVLKTGLSMARNKVETAFYESKIRVNGRKVLKKSEQLRIGDEVDLIRGPSPTNPDFLVVSRIHLLNVKENSDSLTIKVTRNKALVIEQYNDPVIAPESTT